MPAIPSCIIDPIWDQFAALLPEREERHPLGCHNPRISEKVQPVAEREVAARKLKRG